MLDITNNDENTMFYGALPSVFKKARYLREHLTKTEQLLWNKLSNKQLGYKFRRQHPLYKYVVDFYCHQCKLIIELDGEYHNRPSQSKDDKLREEDLKAFGLYILRFDDVQVSQNIDGVLTKIEKILEQLTRNP